MKNRLHIFGIVVLYGCTLGFALKCHQCKNLESVDCLFIKEYNLVQFLKDCPIGTTKCVMEKILKPSQTIERKCANDNWSFKGINQECKTDGCNNANDGVDATPVSTHPTLNTTYLELLQANYKPLVGICLILALLIIWCGVKCCSKDEEDYEYDDEYDYDYDVEANDDGNCEKDDYDDDDDCQYDEEYSDTDSIDKEYDDYAKEAKAAYEQSKQIIDEDEEKE